MFGWFKKQSGYSKDISPFADYMCQGIPEALVMPSELIALFNWIDKARLVHEYPEIPSVIKSKRYGVLIADTYASSKKLTISGNCVSFERDDKKTVQYWFNSTNPEIFERLFIFCRTCDDGSMAALWLDDEGQTRIVHMGSGSGSTWVGLIGETPVDFLRFLAIPYPEHCWPEHFDFTPDELEIGEHPLPNEPYQKWVIDTFKTTIPQKARQIIAVSPQMGEAQQGSDAFSRWVDGVCA